MRDRTSLFDELPAGVWRGRGVRDRTSLFDEPPAGVWRGQGVRDIIALVLVREIHGFKVNLAGLSVSGTLVNTIFHDPYSLYNISLNLI